jgi:hypothetical protein
MRIRIVQKPSVVCIDGVRLDHFEPGEQYEVGNIFGALLLSEGWAEPVDDPGPALVIPLSELERDDAEPLPANLIRESNPPYYPEPLAMALDRRRRSRNRRTS